MIKLTRNLAALDIESTGLSTAEDRIIQLHITVITPDGQKEDHEWILNPQYPISPEASETHGFTADMVADKPTFAQVAIQIHNVLQGCEAVVGYRSNKFDLPMLYNEFARVGIQWNYHDYRKIDVFNIVMLMNPRTLTAMVKQYLGEDLENAHSAGADVWATIRLLHKMKHVHPEIPDDLNELELFSNDGKPFVDLSGTFYMDKEGAIRFSNGKHKDEAVSSSTHKGYLEWMLRANQPPFNEDTKAVINRILNNK